MPKSFAPSPCFCTPYCAKPCSGEAAEERKLKLVINSPNVHFKLSPEQFTRDAASQLAEYTSPDRELQPTSAARAQMMRSCNAAWSSAKYEVSKVTNFSSGRSRL
eukprot:3249766-Pleurochrysis_carterae.AAC.3